MRTSQERMELVRDRQGGLGGTDIAKILNVHPSGEDALDVFYEKTRPIPDIEPPPPTIHQLRGLVSEATVAELYWGKTGRRGRKAPQVFTHPDFPAFRCHLDYEIFSDPEREPEWTRGTGVMEVKAPIAAVFGEIYDRGMRLSESVQLATYIAVTRRDWGSFAFGNLEHKAGPVLVADVKADRRLGDLLLEIGQRFWDEHVVPGVPPDVTEWSGLLRDENAPPILDAAGTLEVVESPEAEAMGRDVLEAIELRKRGEELYRERAKVFQEWMESREDRTDRIEIPGLGKFTIVRQKGRKSFREDTLREARPIDRDKLARWIVEFQFMTVFRSVGEFLEDMTPDGVPVILDGDEDPTLVSALEFLEMMELDLEPFWRRSEPFAFLKATDRRPKERDS